MKTGRPTRGEVREVLVKVTFKADPATVAALERLIKAINVRGLRAGAKSIAIRKALQEADDRLDPATKARRRG